MTKNAAIIGGTGQIGVATAQRLARDGWRVELLHRGERTIDPRVFEFDGTTTRVTTHRIDRSDTDALLEATRGRDLVLDTIAYSPVDADQLRLLGGEVGSLVVISTASVYRGKNGGYLDKATGPENFPDYPVPLREDSPLVDNDEQSYSPLKAAVERRLLDDAALPVSILRPGAIHGAHSPMLREWFFVKRALDERPATLLAYDGESRFSTSATANIAELVALCAESPGRRVLNAVDDESLTVAEMGRIVYEVLGHDGEVRGIAGPPTDAGVGASPWALTHPIVMSMERARTELGYRPVVSYTESVEGDIRWALDAVAAAESAGRTWREAFPALVARYGANEWFPYDAEDAYLARLAH
ncbi:hypothetical protein [Luethyella okanaganae]|uniref:Nucleoside-diphosphate-sugar epimerase n=1 Tax=Luethyella okanaganae TaxID=69372 RepID=A0ABW1VHS3_9MICO